MAHKKANEGGGIVWCHDTGTTCLTFTEDDGQPEFKSRYFARADRESPVFDPALDSLANSLNAMVQGVEAREKTARNRDSKLQIGFLLTSWGFLPVWKRNVMAGERLADLVDVNTLTDLDAMTSEQLNAFLRMNKSEGARQDGGEWHRHSSSGGVIICRGGGKSCFVTALEAEMLSADSDPVSSYFPTVERGSPVFDPALRDLAEKLNAMVTEVQVGEKQNSAKDYRLRIGFLMTGSGFLPIWKIVLRDDEAYEGDADAVDLDGMIPTQRDSYLRLSAT